MFKIYRFNFSPLTGVFLFCEVSIFYLHPPCMINRGNEAEYQSLRGVKQHCLNRIVTYDLCLDRGTHIFTLHIWHASLMCLKTLNLSLSSILLSHLQKTNTWSLLFNPITHFYPYPLFLFSFHFLFLKK